MIKDGDKVRVKTNKEIVESHNGYHWLNRPEPNPGKRHTSSYKCMRDACKEFCGQIVEVYKVWEAEGQIIVEIKNCSWGWAENWFETVDSDFDKLFDI
jgi:hypothetical protein